MSEIIAVGQRRISGTGVLIPEPENLVHRRYALYSDIIRRPQTPYFNADFKPPQTYFGQISLLKDEYVVQTLAIEFDQQMWYFDADISGQNLIAIKCMYLGVLQTFINLGAALNTPPISAENTIANYRALPLQWDKIYVQCYGESAIQLTLKANTYDACDAFYKDPLAPLPKPNKPTEVPTGTPTNIDPPLPGDTISKKAEIDEQYTPPPTGNACEGGVLNFNAVIRTREGVVQTIPSRVAVRGKVGQRWRSIAAGVIQIEAQGYPSEACTAFQWQDVISFGSTTTILDVTNIVFPGV